MMNITIIALVASALTREREEKGDQTPCLLRIPAQTETETAASHLNTSSIDQPSFSLSLSLHL